MSEDFPNYNDFKSDLGIRFREEYLDELLEIWKHRSDLKLENLEDLCDLFNFDDEIKECLSIDDDKLVFTGANDDRLKQALHTRPD